MTTPTFLKNKRISPANHSLIILLKKVGCENLHMQK